MKTSTCSTSLLYAADEKPPVSVSLFQAFQHVVSIYASIVIVPIIIANAIHVPPEQIEYIVFASMIVTSISTLIQAVRLGKIGSGYTLFMGTSGAFMACSLTAAQTGGLSLLATLAIIAAPIEFIFSYFLGYLRKIINSSVGGVVIMLVPVSLIPIAIGLWMGEAGTANYASSENFLVGFVTIAVILLLYFLGNAALRLWSPVIGIIIGYITATYLGMIDFTSVQQAALFGLPKGHWPGLNFSLSAEHVSILITFIIVTLVGAIETVGDGMAIQRVSERNFKKINYERVQGALYSDSLGNLMAGLAGTVPNTTFSGNISMIELTGVASRQVGIYGSAILALLAFSPKLSQLIINIPGPVLGAMLVIFMSMLFVTGMQVATLAGINYQSVIIIGFSFWAGFSAENQLFFPDMIPETLVPLFSNGIAAGGTVAFLLSIIFELIPRKRTGLTLPADPNALNDLNTFLQEISTRFKINEGILFKLQLLCEEIFVYLCSISEKNSSRERIAFMFSEEEDGLLVEIKDRSQADDIDLVEIPEDVAQASTEELDRLGMVMLGKMAKEVNHIRISGVNYISFKLEKN